MQRFAYQARDSFGKSDSGILMAGDIQEASRQLRKDGKTIVSLKEEAANATTLPTQGMASKKVGRDNVIYFANQLTVMVETGVPLTEALDVIAQQTDHPGLKQVVADVSDQIKGGVEFSRALERHPKVFSRLFVSMMRASEASGTMSSMLTRVTEYMADERDTIKRIKGAMVYPICMLSFSITVVIMLLIFVLPKFEKIYNSKNAALPTPTKILLSVSNILQHHGLWIAVGVAGAVIGLVLFSRTPRGRILFDGIRINLPLVGPMYRKAYLARSMRAIGTMVTTGVEMLEGLNITADIAGNYYYERIWRKLADKVKEGCGLSEELAKFSLIPASVSQMISAGERTGRLGQVTNRLATFCEDDLKLAIKTLTTMIEPIMIIVMGMIIGGLALALLLPIFNVSRLMAH